MSGKHALLSPSGAERWMVCPGSVMLSRGLPDSSSVHADEGTAAHELAAYCLGGGYRAANSRGHKLFVCSSKITGNDCVLWDAVDLTLFAIRNNFTIGDEMVTNVQAYVDFVYSLVDDGQLFVEQSTSIEHLTGEEGAEGTSDAVILTPRAIKVVDLKYGQGVRKEAKNNPQLMMYALAAYEEHSVLEDFEEVHLYISQPRLDHISGHKMSIADLLAFGEEVKKAAALATAYMKGDPIPEGAIAFTPGETQCRFCKASGYCDAQDKFVQAAVDMDFEDLVELDRATGMPLPVPDDLEALNLRMNVVDFLDMYAKAVRAKVEAKLFEGATFTDWKLVQGKKGNRAWANPEEVEAMLKKMKIKEVDMYDFKLISPTSAEKLHKAGTIGPRQWPKVQEAITQVDGKPSVQRMSDKRPALVITKDEDDFDNLEDKDLDDLLAL